MKIKDIKVIVASPGRNFVTVKVLTDEGLYGIGDGTVNGREKAVVAYLEDHVIPCLIGRDPARIEDIWQYLYRGAYWRRGPITMAAISAIDMALWDIKAKAANMPLYQLLGGASRDKVMVYKHVGGMTIEVRSKASLPCAKPARCHPAQVRSRACRRFTAPAPPPTRRRAA